MTILETKTAILARIRDEIEARQRFVISSHSRPDGDSIGSQLAMAYALAALGKTARIVNSDPAPASLMAFPGVSAIEIAPEVTGEFDATIVMECSNLSRTGVSGLDRFFTINIDHHPGNSMFGAINWFEGTAAACGEMVFDVLGALGVRLTPEIALHLYVAILTDTGSFHYSSVTPRTFEICRELVGAGVDPESTARQIYDSNSLGRLRLLGAALQTLELEASGRIATIVVDRRMALDAGATYDDTEGLVNLPLTVKEIQAVAFFKESGNDEWRVSLRSKGNVDIARVARQFGGGGHRNAAGCTVVGALRDVRPTVTMRVREALHGSRES